MDLEQASYVHDERYVSKFTGFIFRYPKGRYLVRADWVGQALETMASKYQFQNHKAKCEYMNFLYKDHLVRSYPTDIIVYDSPLHPNVEIDINMGGSHYLQIAFIRKYPQFLVMANKPDPVVYKNNSLCELSMMDPLITTSSHSLHMVG